MVIIKGTTTIIMTRGDTLDVGLEITQPDGSAYQPTTGDVMRFAMARTYGDTPIVNKQMSCTDPAISLTPNETANLDYGEYVYDVELTTADGKVDTIIAKAKLILAEEVE